MWKPLGISYSVSCLVRPVSPELLLNNLKCQSFLGFRTAVSKRAFVLMGNSLPSVAEWTKPLDFFFLIPGYFPDKNRLWRWCFPLGLKKKNLHTFSWENTEVSDNITYNLEIPDMFKRQQIIRDPEVLVLVNKREPVCAYPSAFFVHVHLQIVTCLWHSMS